MSTYSEADWKAIDNDYFQSTWFTTEVDPDILLARQNNLPRMRMLSSWLVRNNFLVSGIREALINNVIGKSLSINVLYRGKTHQRIHSLLNKDLLKVNKDRSKSLVQLLRQLNGMTFDKGDCLVNTSIDKNGIPFAELISGSRISTPFELKSDKSIVDGIKKVDGVPVGAYVRKLQTESIYTKRYKKEDFTYVPFFRKVSVNGKTFQRRVAQLIRSGSYAESDQTRTIPPVIPSANLVRYYEDYLNTVLIGKKVSNAVIGFIRTSDKNSTAANMTGDTSVGSVQKRGMLAPGTIASLNPGEDISFLTPRAQSEGDDLFSRRIINNILFPFRLPYETTVQILKDISYSSWKGGQLETQKSITGWELETISAAKLIINSFLLSYWVKGYTKLSPNEVILDVSIPRPAILDPEKQGRGDKLDLGNKTNSIKRIQDSRGESYEAILAERTQEELDQVKLDAEKLKLQKEFSERYGIIFPETVQPDNRDTSSNRRQGESDGEDLDEEDKRERRREDGNW